MDFYNDDYDDDGPQTTTTTEVTALGTATD
jgi:hypothetical protein